MKFSGRFINGVVLLLISFAVSAQSELVVKVKPANDALKANVEGHIGSLGDRDKKALLRFQRGAQQQALKASQALGYYHPSIEAEVKPGDPPRLVLSIDPGEPLHLRNVNVRVEGPAASLKAFQIQASDDLKPGAVLNHGNYEDAKRMIQNRAQRYGFFNGKFTQHELLVDPKGGFADINLVYESGPRFLLGKVSFAGDVPFDQTLLDRLVPFKPDTPYDSELVVELNLNLQNSGYFEVVRVDAAPSTAVAQVIPIDVDLKTRKPRTMTLGLGYSTDTGARVRASWMRHWGNTRGDSYGFESEISQPKQNVGAWYDIPLDPPLTDKLRLAAGYQNEEIANTDTLSKLLTVGPEWHSKLDSGWTRIVSLKWQHEEYRLGDDPGLSTLLMPGVSYSVLRSDNRIDPSHGYSVTTDMQMAKQGFLSDTNLFHGDVKFEALTTLWDKHRFLGRIQFGGSATNGYKSIPPSLRFFAGGYQSVRGYDYQSLSPKNAEGDRIGGRYMLAGSLEYQYQFAEKWRWATFVDQGKAFNTLDLPSLKTGVGMGIRWISPVGPIRLDLAHALDDDGGVRLHFSMGPEL